MTPRWEPSLEGYIDIAAYLLGADRIDWIPARTRSKGVSHPRNVET